MKSNRRNFIKKSSWLVAGTIIMPTFASISKKMPIGLQIYSVREQLKIDFEGTMKKIAQIGYEQIESYGLGTNGMYFKTMKPAYLKHLVSNLGMKLVSTHCGYFTYKNADKIIEASLISGVEYLTVPAIPRNMRGNIDHYKKVAENFNKIGEKCKAAGIKFTYHNHAFEFKKLDGKIPMDTLLKETDADLVFFEADLFWVVRAGYDPLKLITENSGRIVMFHVKDGVVGMKQETTVGEGIIDFKAIFKAGIKNGLKHYFIEDERTKNPIANIKADYNYISKQNFTQL
ncbi:sugar phosphate isomerase/epimerase [uncultured Polaribacter sp.]|uniref:sugar phosphate isomerase/epimerase family protein n=1 Tax=uncultured Polaribacter sp. TaxID=174711 RepID=UPI0026196AA6|nr:sugar phosphate isomerase/epimerase [uncultured Polaribacter sp.]